MAAGTPLMSMRMENRRFSKFLRNYLQKQMPANAHDAATALAMKLMAKVLEKNPVDFGVSRAGWTKAGELLGLDVPKPRDGKPFNPGVAVAEQSGDRYTITLTNGVEYTVHLETGSSTQAPFGMVRVSMREIEAELGSGSAFGASLPSAIQSIYAETWNHHGLPTGTPLRAGMIRDALGLTEGMNVQEYDE